MLLSDVAISEKEPVFCSIIAAIKYEVPANILLAIAEKERGKPGLWVKNTNGSYDVGFMQFNTTYLQDLKKYGISAEDVAKPGCYSFDLAAWRLRKHLLQDKNDLWTRAANYHSRTPKYNRRYRADLIGKAQKWQHWLEARFMTYSITQPGPAPVKTILLTTRLTTSSQAESEKLLVFPQQAAYNPEAAAALKAAFAGNKGFL